MQNLSDQELLKVRLARRALEVDVAKSVGKYLLETQKGYIKRLTLAIIDKIIALQDVFNVDVFLISQPSFAMWKQCHTVPNLHGLRRVREHVNNYLPPGYDWLNVCSDVIRLFGEIAEQNAVKAMEDTNWHIMAEKKALRPEPVFAKPEHSAEGWGHRHRKDRSADELSRVGAPFIPITRERVEWRGVEKFKFRVDSVIETIDWTFGLQMEGGDVSGTTADSIAALRWASRSTGLVNPVAQLIAIATMIPQGHHTIVEAAWPLTRHGYMNYKIGFYETLVSTGQDYDDLRGLLTKWDRDVRNRHMLVCWDVSRRLQLNFWFDKPDEITEYKKIAGVREAYSFCVGVPPNIKSVENMMKVRGVNNLVSSRMFNWVGRA